MCFQNIYLLKAYNINGGSLSLKGTKKMFLEQEETIDYFVHKVDVYSQRLIAVHHNHDIVLVFVGKISKWGNLKFSLRSNKEILKHNREHGGYLIR